LHYLKQNPLEKWQTCPQPIILAFKETQTVSELVEFIHILAILFNIMVCVPYRWMKSNLPNFQVQVAI